MKTYRLLLVVLFAFPIYPKGFAQQVQLFVNEPLPLEITENKTVNLVFPFAVKSVDKGSRDVLVQKAKGVENVLLVKAARRDFTQTNLTVITSDGQLFSFTVDYADDPLQTNLTLIRDSSSSLVIFNQVNEADVMQTAQLIAENRVASGRSDLKKINHSGKVSLSLTGIYTARDIIFFRFLLDNRSNLSFQAESLRFLIKDKKQVKRAAIQEKEIIPVVSHGHLHKVEGQTYSTFVIAVSKFTIPDKKYLAIRITEKDGGRHLNLKVKNKTIVKAKPISE
jgi:conjugative transposon TraN protein